MRWSNTETKTFSDTTENAFTEVLDLVDRDGNVLKKFSKAADGSLTETTVSVTAPVARVVTGTIDTALSGTPALLVFGNLRITTVAEGEGIPDDDDGTELIPYLAANVGSIPADNVVDNEDLTFTITFHPGANTLPVSSADAALTFAEDVAGADEVSELVAVTSSPVGSTFITPTPDDGDGAEDEFVFESAPTLVLLGGLIQEPGEGNDYTLDGVTVTFNTAPDNEVKVRGLV